MSGQLMDHGRRKYLLFFSLFLLVTNAGILLDIPGIRPIFGFAFLTIVPGLLVMALLQAGRLTMTAKLVLGAGISISIVYLVGIVENIVLFSSGIETPLATIPLLLVFDAVLVLLFLVAWPKLPEFPKISLHLKGEEKIIVIISVFLPVLGIVSMFVMNRSGNYAGVVLLYAVITVLIIAISLRRHQIPERIYPFVIFCAGLSILLLLPFRSSHLIGLDTHLEYYVFQITNQALHWRILGLPGLDSSLSISLLPVIYQSLLGSDPEMLFKVLYPLFFSVAPLALFCFVRKYLSAYFAFLCALFFVFQEMFLYTELNARTSLAILFFILIIFVTFTRSLHSRDKTILMVFFMFSCVVSHYSTTMIVFFIFTATLLMYYAGTTLLRRFGSTTGLRHLDPYFPVSYFLIFSIMILAWYSLVYGRTFFLIVTYMQTSANLLNDYLLFETTSREVDIALGKYAFSASKWIKFGTYWSMIGIIFFGAVRTVLQFRTCISFRPRWMRPDPDFRPGSVVQERIDFEYVLLSVAFLILLSLSIIISPIIAGYNLSRLFLNAIPLLSIFFIIGCVTLASLVRFRRPWIFIIAFLVLLSICTSSLVDPMFGQPGIVTISTRGDNYDMYYVHDSEAAAAVWMNQHGLIMRGIFTDLSGDSRLISQGPLNFNYITRSEAGNTYTFVRYLYASRPDMGNFTVRRNANKIFNAGGAFFYAQ
jgi:uncharacterized membrane protein